MILNIMTPWESFLSFYTTVAHDTNCIQSIADFIKTILTILFVNYFKTISMRH